MNGKLIALRVVCFTAVVASLFLVARRHVPGGDREFQSEEQLESPPPALTTPPLPPAAPSPAPLRTTAAAASTPHTFVPPPLPGLSTGPLAWEQQLAAATRGRSGADKARAIFQLLPQLPEEALATAAEQATERLPDRDYPETAGPLVTSAQTPRAALTVLFADLMERPDEITLPLLLSIARTPEHPFAAAALDNLRLLLKTDRGPDWARWDSAIRETLAKPR